MEWIILIIFAVLIILYIDLIMEIWWIILIIVVCFIIYGTIAGKKDLQRKSKFEIKNHHNEYAIRKIRLIEQRGAHCEECGRGGSFYVHHIIPVSEGGSYELNNLKLLCSECYFSKHNYNLDEIGISKKRPLDKYERIGKAIYEKKKLEIKYQAYNGEITTRIISPKKTVEKEGITYIEAFCYLRNEERTFRISRIKNAKIIKD